LPTGTHGLRPAAVVRGTHFPFARVGHIVIPVFGRGRLRTHLRCRCRHGLFRPSTGVSGQTIVKPSRSRMALPESLTTCGTQSPFLGAFWGADRARKGHSTGTFQRKNTRSGVSQKRLISRISLRSKEVS
jgi:hypothetical protein